MRANPITFLICLIAFFSSSFAAASEIGSGSRVKKTHDVHESITRIAEFCVIRSQGQPQDCSDLFPFLRSYSKRAITTFPGEFVHAVRWPDDPTRQLDRNRTKLNFGLKMFRSCKGALSKARYIDDAGLLCSSHFGKLQFFHAQSALKDSQWIGPLSGMREKMTVQNILSWTEFSFNAATDKSFGEGDYCNTIAGLGPRHAGLKEALTLGDPSYCQSRDEGKKAKRAWQVKTLYSMRCGKIFSSSFRCKDLSYNQSYELPRLAAIGAILHMIQDSYSQSHAARIAINEEPLEPTGNFQAIVRCEPIARFYNYQDQNESHAKADKTPSIDASCYRPDRQVDDVITATAKAIWFIQTANDGNRLSKRDQLIRYLKDRVFRLIK